MASQPEPCTGAGLTDTARRAMAAAGLGDAEVHTLTHDATGEPYRADEFGFTALRLARRLAPEYRRITPALATRVRHQLTISSVFLASVSMESTS